MASLVDINYRDWINARETVQFFKLKVCLTFGSRYSRIDQVKFLQASSTNFTWCILKYPDPFDDLIFTPFTIRSGVEGQKINLVTKVLLKTYTVM